MRDAEMFNKALPTVIDIFVNATFVDACDTRIFYARTNTR